MHVFRIALCLSAVWAGRILAADREVVGEAGGFAVKLKLDEHWKVTGGRSGESVVLRYAHAAHPDAGEVRADIGVFRTVLPEAARSAAKGEIASALVANDALKAQRAMLGQDVRLVAVDKRPELFRGGEVWRFFEADVVRRRISVTTLRNEVRVWFPAEFATQGVVFIILGRENTEDPTETSVALAKTRAVMEGIVSR